MDILIGIVTQAKDLAPASYLKLAILGLKRSEGTHQVPRVTKTAIRRAGWNKLPKLAKLLREGRLSDNVTLGLLGPYLREYTGGMTGKHHSQATKDKIGEANKKALKGRHLSDEHKKHIGMAFEEGHLSEAHKGKMGAANAISNKGHIPWMKGRHHNEVSKQMMAKSHTGIKDSESARRNKSIAQTNRWRKIRELQPLVVEEEIKAPIVEQKYLTATAGAQ